MAVAASLEHGISGGLCRGVFDRSPDQKIGGQTDGFRRAELVGDL